MTHIQRSTIVPEELAGRRLDQAAARLWPEFSRNRLKAWIKAGELRLDGEPAAPRSSVAEGQALTLDTHLSDAIAPEPEAIELDVVHQDEHILVIDKPAGLIVHPGAGNPSGTLQNALLNLAPELKALPRAGIVHRLDKDTSGLLVVARSLTAHTALVDALQRHDVERLYEAVCVGALTGGGTVREPIGRHRRDRLRMAVTPGGKPAVTHYRIERRFPAHTHLRVRLETGRTHQIRVHMSHIRHPLVGDTLYGGRLKLPAGASDSLRETLRSFRRQALHARRLEFVHPASGKRVDFESPLPADFQALLKALAEN